MQPLNIIVGHGNMDLDCIGSIVLAKYLFPGHTPIRSSRIHPAARNLYNLYETHLNFGTPQDLKGRTIDTMVIVDTRAAEQVEEYFRHIDEPRPTLEIFDHHPSDNRDIPDATIHECAFGANTTQLALKLMRTSTAVIPEDATIALTAIYADTGNFLHPNVCREDFDAAAFLLEHGAELSLVKEFLIPLREKSQLVLFHEVLNKMETRIIRGHSIQTCYLEMDEDTQGLGAVVEKVFEVENSEMLIGFFFFTGHDRLLIIARNSCDDIHINEILADFGGGGHKQAAAATIKTQEGPAIYGKIMNYLQEALSPALSAEDIMTRDVMTLSPDMSLLDAAICLEQSFHTGAPVIDEAGRISGFLTLRDIMKGRKLGKMSLAVKAFMARTVICAAYDTGVREIEEILFVNNIGHLPITCDQRLVGIVTRSDLLNYLRGAAGRKKLALESMGMETIK